MDGNERAARRSRARPRVRRVPRREGVFGRAALNRRIATGGGTVLEFSAAFNAFFQHGVRKADAGLADSSSSVRVAVVLTNL